MKPTKLPTVPRGYACARYRVSTKNRRAAAWRSVCAAAVALYQAVAKRVAGF